MLKEKVTSLPDDHRRALAADLDEIVYMSTGDISIYYDEKGNEAKHGQLLSAQSRPGQLNGGSSLPRQTPAEPQRSRCISESCRRSSTA